MTDVVYILERCALRGEYFEGVSMEGGQEIKQSTQCSTWVSLSAIKIRIKLYDF